MKLEIVGGGAAMPRAKKLRENAENCAEMAENARDDASRRRYQRMELTYLHLAETEDWLDGQMSPSARQVESGSN
ncbi:MAG: hypothetical protein ABWY66_14765 [Xanthobacteraceae bacterium]|jgi:hypothetical protein